LSPGAKKSKATPFNSWSTQLPAQEEKSWVHWRWQCPIFLLQTFVEWAGQTINKSFWAGAYYRQHRAKGASHQVAGWALAFKWIRVLYRCWQTGQLSGRWWIGAFGMLWFAPTATRLTFSGRKS
jgi:hypothetical protein